MENLVTLLLTKIPSSAYFHPNVLLQRLYIMPQLEVLWIGFNHGRDVERQLLRTPIVTRVTLPNLRWLGFLGSSTYLEVLLPWVTAPLVNKLRIHFLNRMIYSTPHLLQFTSTARNFQVKTVEFEFQMECLKVWAYPHVGARMDSLEMSFGGRHLDWQIVSASQVFHAFCTVFSMVEHLTLKYYRLNVSSEWNNEADRIYWREVLGSFEKVKSLSVADELVEQLSRALQVGEGESPTALLPELQELSYFASDGSRKRRGRNSFIRFVIARQNSVATARLIAGSEPESVTCGNQLGSRRSWTMVG